MQRLITAWVLGILSVGLVASPAPAEAAGEAAGEATLTTQEPFDPAELEQRAEALYAEDRLEEAAELYLRLAARLEGPSEQARTLVLAAWLQTLRGRPDLSSRTLEQALDRDPGYRLDPQAFSEAFQATFEALREARQAGSALPSGASLNEGLRLLREGDLVGARAVFEQAAALDPNDDQIQFLLARIESRLGETDAALPRLERLQGRLDRGEPLTVTRAQIDAEIGITAYRAGDLQTAVRAFGRAVEREPGDIGSWHNLGLAHNQLGDPQRASEAFRRALALGGSDRVELERLLANILLRTGDDSEAADLLRSLTAAGSGDSRIWFDLGLAEQRIGNSEAAIDALERAAQLDPRNELEIGAVALDRRATLLLEVGDFRSAVSDARAALAMDARDVDALNVLGLALIELAETGEAALNLERARALAPERADLANNLGKALFGAGRLEESIEAFEAALELDPDLATARDNLGVARQALEGAGVPASTPGQTTAPERADAPTRPRERSSRESETATATPIGATFADVRHPGTGRDAVEVVSVQAGGMAERAGLRVGDLILRVGGQGVGGFGVENAASLVRRLAALDPGDGVRLDLFRGQEALAVTIRR